MGSTLLLSKLNSNDVDHYLVIFYYYTQYHQKTSVLVIIL